MQLSIRALSYIAIFFAYLGFMYFYSPLGIGWLDWHGQRIFNAVEFLKLNGYFNAYGFTIWDVCNDCTLDSQSWNNKIYFSAHGISMMPYIVINHFGGKELLFIIGPLIDKLAIFSCAILISELLIKSIVNLSNLPKLFIGLVCFSLFVASPWTFKMFLAAWFEVYFLLFFLLGMFFFQAKKLKLGYISFFFSALFHIQWALAAIIFYSLVFVGLGIYKRGFEKEKYFPAHSMKINQSIRIIFSLLIPVLAFFLIRFFAQQDFQGSAGSTILYRIGIAGNDIHNGGLIGALQFLGGNRITQCIEGINISNLSQDMSIKIAMFNCLLSILGMIFLSVLSIFGCYLLIKNSPFAKLVFLPQIFSLMLFIAIFQQSLSVHLMGYSFIFSMIFAIGLTYFMIILHKRFGSSLDGLIFSIPCILGILILSIRVSFLTGING